MNKKHFIIKSGDENAGFTAYIKFALNGILHAEQHDLIPVVNFDNSIRNFFYEESYGENTWEYYFEPVAEVSYANVIANNLPNCTLKERQFRNQNSHPNPDRVDTFWKSDRKIGGDEHKGDPKKWLESKRKTARQLMKRYVRVKPHIRKVVDNFVNENFNNKNIIGCHVRGTDFSYATATSVEKYFEILDTQKDVHIFLATDQTQYVELFKERYGDEKVLTYDSLRSDNDVAAFELENGSPYKKGEDVLIDTLLLSRTNSIIKCAAAGGEFALWFNENLEVLHDFALESKFQKGGHWNRENTAFNRLGLEK